MIETNELITLLLGLGIAGFYGVYYRRLRGWSGSGWLCAAYAATMVGWILTVAEGFWFPDLLNTVEHVAYGTGGALLAGFLLRGGPPR